MHLKRHKFRHSYHHANKLLSYGLGPAPPIHFENTMLKERQIPSYTFVPSHWKYTFIKLNLPPIKGLCPIDKTYEFVSKAEIVNKKLLGAKCPYKHFHLI